MSRMSSPEQIVVRPTNNVYTALVVICVVVEIVGAIVLMAAKHLVKIEELKEVRAASRVEFRIALVALLGVLVFGLLNGLLLAALGSMVVLIARATRPAIAVLARDATGRFVNQERLEAPAATMTRAARTSCIWPALSLYTAPRATGVPPADLSITIFCTSALAITFNP